MIPTRTLDAPPASYARRQFFFLADPRLILAVRCAGPTKGLEVELSLEHRTVEPSASFRPPLELAIGKLEMMPSPVRLSAYPFSHKIVLGRALA